MASSRKVEEVGEPPILNSAPGPAPSIPRKIMQDFDLVPTPTSGFNCDSYACDVCMFSFPDLYIQDPHALSSVSI